MRWPRLDGCGGVRVPPPSRGSGVGDVAAVTAARRAFAARRDAPPPRVDATQSTLSSTRSG
eukprot:1240436-Prymnesium_polylepis.1